MQKIIAEIRLYIYLVLGAALLVVLITSCIGAPVSIEKYNEISTYVLENKDVILHEHDKEFFDYESSGLTVSGVYYGYYYTSDNEVVVPDLYSGDNLGHDKYNDDGGTYFGKPNDGTDWCFVKQITDNWYYYELHWG